MGDIAWKWIGFSNSGISKWNKPACEICSLGYQESNSQLLKAGAYPLRELHTGFADAEGPVRLGGTALFGPTLTLFELLDFGHVCGDAPGVLAFSRAIAALRLGGVVVFRHGRLLCLLVQCC